MKRSEIILFAGYILLFNAALSGCRPKPVKGEFNKFCKDELSVINKKLTKVLIADVFNPPVCSRIYAYCNIAAYEALRPIDKTYTSYAGRLNGLSALPKPKANTAYCYPVSSIIAFTTVAQKLVYNTDSVKVIEANYLQDLVRMGVSKSIINESVQYGRSVGTAILKWAKKDGYLQRNSRPGYTVTRELGRWQPTPPDYMDAIEPNWNTLRPFLLDSAAQFKALRPTKFDTLKGSQFYKDAYDVYNVVKNTDHQKIEAAKYWDCNPNVSVTQGHVMFFLQKISPGGHWIHVASSICQKEGFEPMKTADIISKVAISLADAFISCWDTKYKNNSIRPETYINKYIDKDWKPLLQTPPFPEYTSGHSVASTCAATMLTHLLGDKYAYIDSTEVPFGIHQRLFKNFQEASNEACISRFYGGIHFMPSIKNGMDQGRKIGEFEILKLK